MNQSEKIDALAAALVKAQAEFPDVAKNCTNPHLRNRYADLGAIWNAVKPVLGRNGLAVIQGGETPVANAVEVETTIVHTSGQWMTRRYHIATEQTKGINAPQAAGVAITYGRRYGLASMLMIIADDDTDGVAGTPPQCHSSPSETRQPSPAAGAPQPKQKAASAAPGASPVCPKCGGDMWDNRERRAKAEAEIAAGTRTTKPPPAWSCKDKACDGKVWPSNPYEDKKPKVPPTTPTPAAPTESDSAPANSLEMLRRIMREGMDGYKPDQTAEQRKSMAEAWLDGRWRVKHTSQLTPHQIDQALECVRIGVDWSVYDQTQEVPF